MNWIYCGSYTVSGILILDSQNVDCAESQIPHACAKLIQSASSSKNISNTTNQNLAPFVISKIFLWLQLICKQINSTAYFLEIQLLESLTTTFIQNWPCLIVYKGSDRENKAKEIR